MKANPNIVAYMVEPIQGEKGVVVPPEGNPILYQRISKKMQGDPLKIQCLVDYR